jgi:hypothetical protein
MRVALYLKHYPASGAPVRGGSATAVDGLASGLAQNGAEAVVLCEGAARSSADAAGGYRIECFENRGRYRSFMVARELRDYAAGLLGGASGVCVLNGNFHPSCFALGRALRRQGVPYVAQAFDPYDRWMFGRNPHLKWPYWLLFERRHVRAAGCGIAVPPSVEGIAEGLRSLLERRSSWSLMGERGRSYALQRLQWKSIAADALAGYARLLA